MSDQETEGPRIAAILGTARPGNYTSKALALVIDEIERNRRFSVRVIDPSKVDLPLPGSDPDSAQMVSLRETVSGRHGAGFCHARVPRHLQQRDQADHREPRLSLRAGRASRWPFSASPPVRSAQSRRLNTFEACSLTSAPSCCREGYPSPASRVRSTETGGAPTPMSKRWSGPSPPTSSTTSRATFARA